MNTPRKYPDFSKLKIEIMKIVIAIYVYKKRIKNLTKQYSIAQDYQSQGLIVGKLKTCFTEYDKLKNHYRHMHIAYCELHGRTREQIENKTSRAKPLSEDVIKRIKIQFTPESPGEE